MGGLSAGFARAGWEVTGIDINPWSARIFELNEIGTGITADLSIENVEKTLEMVSHKFDVVMGGPPCRPWSNLNLKKRRYDHEDHELLYSFFHIVKIMKPKIFVLENVPPLASDPILKRLIVRMKEYTIAMRTVRYSAWGAATSRKRLFVIGTFENFVDPSEIFKRLDMLKKQPSTFREVAGYLWNMQRGEEYDHEWPDLKTIDKYLEKYRNRKFGWFMVDPDRPVPSFGNIMKTYVLHPSRKRVLSIKEAMLIMGFDRNYRFPDGMGSCIRYQMVADTVSPVFSKMLANVLKEVLTGVPCCEGINRDIQEETFGLVAREQKELSVERNR